MKQQIGARADERWIQDYLSGRLSDAEAEELEARCLADDALGGELERALEIRAALRPAATSRGARMRAGGARLLPPLAIAAGAAMLAVGVYWLRAPPESPPVFRGAEQRMRLEVEVIAGELSARWEPVSGAARYELRVFARDGRLMRSLVVDGAAAAIDLRGAGTGAAPEPAFVDVAALDDFGQTVLRSERIRLPDPDGPRE